MSAGYYKRRRGILEHLENGRIGLIDLAIHDFLNLKANLVIDPACSIPPGVCFSSSVAIHELCPREISERRIRRSLEHLERIGWINRWPTRGKRGNYPILVCRASVHDLSAVEYRVNGAETIDWRHPVLIPAALRPHSGREVAGYREKRIENREKKNPAAKTPRPADPRFKPFYEHAFESYRSKHGQAPLWASKEQKRLHDLLRAHGPQELSLDRLKGLWSNLVASTEAFTVNQGDSLAYFCSNIGRFAAGPISTPQQKGKINADQRTRDNAAVAATARLPPN